MERKSILDPIDKIGTWLVFGAMIFFIVKLYGYAPAFFLLTFVWCITQVCVAALLDKRDHS